MALLVVSFIAGLITVLTPCVLPVLPVIIGSSAASKRKLTPYVVVGSLSVSIVIFTYVLKVSTAFIMIPPQTWIYLSGAIFILFGLALIFPDLWAKIPLVSKINIRSNIAAGKGYKRESFFGDIIVGAALGPIFSTCSPTYFVILATVLPVSFALGITYILAYVLGLALVLLLVALLGQKFSNRLALLADPKSKTKKVIGIIFIILGILIATGYEKKIETMILDSGYFDVTKIEQKVLQIVE